MKADLSLATNMFGPLKPDLIARIERYLAKPTVRGWEDIHGIFLDGETFIGVWEAVNAIDPTFPKTGRTTDARGRVIEEWRRIPSSEQVLQAIAYATH